MNRKIAFRAWDGQKLHFGHGCFTDQSSKTWLVHDDNIFPPQAYVQGELMQFTGLLDKNGKEIYEGDMLGFGTGMARTLHQVEWDAKYCCFVWMNKEPWYPNRDLDCHRVEVIGNIYENPNLLTL